MEAPASPRLRFRPPRWEDWRAFAEYRADPEFLAWYPDEIFDAEAARAFVARFLDWRFERPRRRFAWVVTRPDEARAVGMCSIRLEEAGATTAEIGFELARSEWGHGFATEMGSAMLRVGFETLGVHRIQAHCLAENAASRRVLERLGLRLEGRLRERHRFKERFHDELWYGILRGEWEGTASPAGESAEGDAAGSPAGRRSSSPAGEP